MKKNWLRTGQDPVVFLTLQNGLTVNLINKPGYKQTVASLTVKFGSLTSTYQDRKGKTKTIPAGTAHFLEHKLFDKPEGDVLIKMADLGADGNAFTSNQVTCYYLATHENLRENIELLLDFVQTPVFSEESVKRERGIIEEEIASYQDDPDSRLYQGMLRTAYPNSQLGKDIAGDAFSLQKISSEVLYDVYHNYYRPDNMVLTVVGDLNQDQLCQWIQSNQQAGVLTKARKISVDFANGRPVQVRQDEEKLNVSLERIAWLGGLEMRPNRCLAEQELLAEFVLELVFGEQTDWYQSCYQEGVLGDDFDFEVSMMPGYAYVMFFSSGPRAEEQEKVIQTRLNLVEQILSEDSTDFSLLKRSLIGEKIQQQDQLTSLALDEDLALYGLSLFDKMNLLNQLEQRDLADYARVTFKRSQLAQFIVKKQDNG
ncbi:EF-P 5-aminopentanol modification-associated protein YfmH [Fructobacillus fructosus]|uniref:EF-P 5-aminopentanol modification-associated protein YfmH n=1 Tax=Fructobacillus fructosus TaxID=1631 RepID=UPI002D819CCE|nr:M16 family (PqqL) [Fructobacillus fructosus]CAK1235437.1 M16 family (PqqL) [Fructobacillus fructosus]CAK1237009.1 M16 family (PqqL) [Fructobacillus fructosus]